MALCWASCLAWFTHKPCCKLHSYPIAFHGSALLSESLLRKLVYSELMRGYQPAALGHCLWCEASSLPYFQGLERVMHPAGLAVHQQEGLLAEQLLWPEAAGPAHTTRWPSPSGSPCLSRRKLVVEERCTARAWNNTVGV